MGESTDTLPGGPAGSGEQWKAFAALAEASADGIVMLDAASEIQYANPAVERILGYDPEDLVGASKMNIIPDRLRDDHREAFQRYLDTGEKHIDWTYVELPGLHREGHEVPLGISFNEFTHDGDRFFVGMLRDISERKRVERELEKNRQQLRMLVRMLPVGIIVADAHGSLVEANQTARRTWGGFADADSVAEYEQYAGWWADTGNPVEPEEWPLARALRGEEVTAPDLIEIEGFDGERRTVLFHAMPIRDDDGAIQRAVVTMVDVSEREARKRRLRRQNERLDRFASMLAHELRNPLEIAMIYLDLLDSEDTATVEQVGEALDRIDEIIDVLLILARGLDEVGDRETVDLAAAVEDAWADVESDDAEFEVASTRTLSVNPMHLRQLLQNLFRNAVEHSDGSVAVRVGALADGFYVEDTGPGIPEDEREDVVEPGYTTHDGGTGLGLTFVAELANVYGWGFAITDGEAGGARFEFTGVETPPDDADDGTTGDGTDDGTLDDDVDAETSDDGTDGR
ncbi:PAS domain S-box protein [Halorussus gelatinilyticus]|uniref:histidine kinase n=1 Tax=Halorussus gelatinilyticus TaxID=2937524 RepID=A0A8U0IN74_9EURY|nr:PAS domain S-box protein [Halorussus gelatinilyticus]UPW01624.1 PAS domain S-box protein [Halorussus gelatinilyticus]